MKDHKIRVNMILFFENKLQVQRVACLPKQQTIAGVDGCPFSNLLTSECLTLYPATVVAHPMT
jgi:hypothetical protein